MRTAPAGAFVLHHTKIGKDAMKKFEICSQCGAVNLFWSSFSLSIGRGPMNSQGPLELTQSRVHLTDVRIFIPLLEIALINCQLQNKEALAESLMGSHMMIYGCILSKIFAPIHLQYWGLFDRLPLLARFISTDTDFNNFNGGRWPDCCKWECAEWK